MTTTLLIHTEYLMPGKKVLISEAPRGVQASGMAGTLGEITYQGQSTTVTVHDNNQVVLTEVDADTKKEE